MSGLEIEQPKAFRPPENERDIPPPKPSDSTGGFPPKGGNPEKQGLPGFTPDAFCGTIKASEEEAGIDGKRPEGLQDPGV